jgi:2,3-bisphosphoglycerate-dependent phosphoglycerate mutase
VADAARLLLLRHAASDFDATLSDAERGLSELGVEQADALVAQLLALQPDRLFASPYRRARDTVLPLANALGLAVTIDPALKECAFQRHVGEAWPAPIRRAWSAPAVGIGGGEAASLCQRRVIDCLTRLRREHPGQCLLVASHGNAIALALNYLDPAFDFDCWQRMPMPALFEVDIAGRAFRSIALASGNSRDPAPW